MEVTLERVTLEFVTRLLAGGRRNILCGYCGGSKHADR